MGAFSIALGRTFFNLQKIRREVYIFFRYSNKKRVLRVAKPIKVICSIPIGKNRFNNIKSYIFIKKQIPSKKGGIVFYNHAIQPLRSHKQKAAL